MNTNYMGIYNIRCLRGMKTTTLPGGHSEWKWFDFWTTGGTHNFYAHRFN